MERGNEVRDEEKESVWLRQGRKLNVLIQIPPSMESKLLVKQEGGRRLAGGRIWWLHSILV